MSIEDKAQEHEAQVLAIHNMQRKLEPAVKAPGDPGYGPEDCVKCGDEMPAVRRSYGFTLCTPCKSALEVRRVR